MASPAPSQRSDGVSDGGTDATCEIGFSGDFATLTPDNAVATVAFDRVVALLEHNDDSSAESYHKQFVSILPSSLPHSEPESASSSFSQPAPPSSERPASSPSPPPSAPAPAPTIGHYRLSLDFLPESLDGRWRIGKGSSRAGDGRGVDLLLVPPGQHRGTGVSNVHALISIHQRSGAFMLHSTSNRPIIYLSAAEDGGDLVLRHGEQTVLWMATNRLRIGALDYLLHIAVEHEGHFKTIRDEFLATVLNERSRPHPKLDVIPQPYHHKTTGGYLIHKSISVGAFGMVRSAVDSATGEPVAVKRVLCKGSAEARAVGDEARIASKFVSDDADGGIIPVLSTWCEHGAAPPCNDNPEDIFLAMPLALADFGHTDWRCHPMATRLALFRSTLAGLAKIHGAGVMHRDISPKNLLIRSFDPPLAAICDFGKATDKLLSCNTAIGPIDTVAPEVWTSEPRCRYGPAVDIWSLGYAWLSTFGSLRGLQSAAENLKTDSTRVIRIHKVLDGWVLDGTISKELGDLLHNMLQYQPRKRCTAEQALLHRVWEVLQQEDAESVAEEEEEEEAPRKRPRLLTPELDEMSGEPTAEASTMPDTEPNV
ncbi:hypothetical protein OQA88_6074 [Cercophora sp. LCS_1]